MPYIKSEEYEELLSFSPRKNPKAIAIVQQEDGNWKGYAQKFGKVIEVREIGPDTVLQMILTHNGEV